MQRKLKRITKKLDQINSLFDQCMARLVTIAQIEDQDTSIENALIKTKNLTNDQIIESLKKARESYLHLGWIEDTITECQNTIKSIDIERYLVFKKAGQNTSEIYEEKLESIIRKLNSEKIYGHKAIEYIFERSTDKRGYSVDSLKLAEEIKAIFNIIEKRIKRLKSRWLEFIHSKIIPISLITLAIVSIPISYFVIIHFFPGESVSESVVEMITQDVKSVTETVKQEKSFIEKLADFVEALSRIGHGIPGILLLLGIITAIMRSFLNREHWKHQGLKGVEEELLTLGNRFKNLIG